MASDTEKQLLQLCTNGNLPSLKDFITKQRLNPNGVKDSSGLTLLHLACQHGHLDIAQYFIEDQKCHPETTTPNGRTPLHIACESGHLHIAKCLITDHKCSPHCTDNDGYTPLHAASENVNIETVKYLITEQGCDPQVSDSIGNTPLHYASKSGHLDIVKCLITEFNCDPQKTNNRGSIPLHYACRGGKIAVAMYLINEHQCNPNCTNIFGNTSLHFACLTSCLPLVKYLIDEHDCNPKIVNNDGLTPLHSACLNGHLDITKYLLSNCTAYNPDICSNMGFVPLHYACQNGHLEVAKYLITEHKCSPEQGNVNGYTPLHSAASNGHLDILKYLISEVGCNLQITDNDGDTPLHYACLNGHLDITKFLISNNNCDPQFSANSGNTPLHYTCQNGHLEVAKYLITEHNCSPEQGNVDDYTPLHSAASNGHLAVLKYLISELDCNAQGTTNDGLTPLHYACLNGHLDVTKYLTSDCNSNSDHLTNIGNTPLHCACENGHLVVAEYLITEHNCNPECGNIIGCTPLHSAVSNGHLAVVKYLISELGCNPQIVDSNGHTPLNYVLNLKIILKDLNSGSNHGTVFVPFQFACQKVHFEVAKYLISECGTPLHSAASKGHLPVVKYLINELGCNAQIADNDCDSLLHYACLNGHLNITKYLISDCNCNPESTANNGFTPLHYACENGHLEVAKYLITEHNCSPEHGNVNGITPLHSAASKGHLAVVKYLISEHGCNPQITDNDGYTLLHYACLNGNLDITKYLISDCNCNPQCSEKNGFTPLSYACENGHLEVAKYLITEHKCSPEQGNANGCTPLHSAAWNGHLAVVKYLISELGYNPQIADNDGFTLLHCACLGGHLDITKYLISDCNCNPESLIKKECVCHIGNTPLHCACENGHLEVAKYLISEHKCSPEQGNVNGYTPLHSAASNGHLAVVEYLLTQCNSNPQCSDNNGFTLLHAACDGGQLHVAKYLIHEQNCAIDPEANQPLFNFNGLTPLHYACMNGYLDITKYLISDCNCNPECSASNGFTPLHCACEKGHYEVVDYLITQCNCNAQCRDINGITPLHLACGGGHLHIAKYLIHEQNCAIDPEANQPLLNFSGLTPLHYACRKGHLDIIEYLISDCNCNPECSASNGFTPLHLACEGGHLHIAKYLILEQNCACNPEANQPLFDVSGIIPLHVACEGGHLDIVKYLVDVCKCNPNCSTSKGLTAIDIAQLAGHQEVVAYLKHEHQCSRDLHQLLTRQIYSEATCNHLQENSNGMSIFPLHQACLIGNLEAVKMCITKTNSDPSSVVFLDIPLYFSCIMGHLEIVKYLIAEHKYSPQLGNVITLLHVAVLFGHLCVVKYFISELNCYPQIADVNGNTLLHCACQNGRLEITKYLISEYKCSPECGNVDGYTPLHLAARNGHLDVVKYLITCNCNPQCTNINGITPLHEACYKGHLHVIKYLIQKQHCACEPKAKLSSEMIKKQFGITDTFLKVHGSIADVDGITPLHFACGEGHLDIVKYLICVCNCNPNHSTNNGITAIDSAQIHGHQEVVSYLRSEHQCNVNLIQPTMPGPFSLLQGLLNDGCLNCDDFFVSPLGTACITGDLAAVKFHTTRSNYDPSSPVHLGLTPIHVACMTGRLEIAKYLVRVGRCDPNCISLSHHGTMVTPVFIATIFGQLEAVKWLISEQKCEPVCRATFPFCQCEHDVPLVIPACMLGHLSVMKYLLSESSSQNFEKPCLPSFACLFGQLHILKYLIDECKCNPMFTANDGSTPLHHACGGIQNLVCHISAMRSTPSVQKLNLMQILHVFIVTLLTNVLPKIILEFFHSGNELSNYDVPTDIKMKRADHDDRTIKEQLTVYNNSCLDVVKYLITEHECDPQCKDKKGQTPLHYACTGGQLEIVQYLYSNKLSDLVHTAHSGDTPLHFACKYNQVEVVQFLLSTGECDPLIENAVGLSSLEITTSPEIRQLLDHFCKGKYPLESVVKLFVLGDPLAGKSSLVQAIQSNTGFFSSLFGRFQRVKGVRQQSVGIDSVSFSSSDFGDIVIYDFAGQREFHKSCASFLLNYSSHKAEIFIVVTNIAQCEDAICQSLHYWMSFIRDCCTHNKMKPHVILVGSHADQLGTGGDEIALMVIEKGLSPQNTNQFCEAEGIVCLDCTKPASPQLDLLHYYLEESCNSIRQKTEKIDQRCYVLQKYFRKTYSINKSVPGCNLKDISKELEGNPYLLPSNPNELLPLFRTLHDKGQLLFLKNNQNIGDSWVITNIAAMLETVVGSIFAPRNFPQHTAPDSTGIVPKSRMSEAFPNLNTNMVIGFLEHFEFCHRVEPDWLGETQSNQLMSDDEYYLFPALLTSENIPQVLQERYESSYCCGWFMYCTVEDWFFSTQFLHVLLLRLAFLFAPPQDEIMPSSRKIKAPALSRRCNMWKSGISWPNTNGVKVVFEVKDLKTATLKMMCMEGREIHCVRLRTKLIRNIMKAKNEICPNINVEECIIEVEPGNFQTEVECPSHSIKYLSNMIANRDPKDDPDQILTHSDGNSGKRVSELLYFEPYAVLTPDLITQLFAKENAKEKVPSSFITELATRIYPFNDALEKALKPDPSILSGKHKQVHSDSLGEISKQQLRCKHILEAWLEHQQPAATYKKLQEELNEYSIFCGRNPLNLSTGNNEESSDSSGENDTNDSETHGGVDTSLDVSKISDTVSQVNLSTQQSVLSPNGRHLNGGDIILTEEDLAILLDTLKPATPHWKAVGLALGFQNYELTIIERTPLLIPEGLTGYFREMLSQWLKWAPPNHSWPTLETLQPALQSCGHEELAVQLMPLFLTKKVASVPSATWPSKEQRDSVDILAAKIKVPKCHKELKSCESGKKGNFNEGDCLLYEERDTPIEESPFQRHTSNMTAEDTEGSEQRSIEDALESDVMGYNEALQQIADIATDLLSKHSEFVSNEKDQRNSALHSSKEDCPGQESSIHTAADVTTYSEQKDIVDEALQQIADITENLVSGCFELLEFQDSPSAGIAKVSVQEDGPTNELKYAKFYEVLQVVVDIAEKLVSRCFEFELSLANQERERNQKNGAVHIVCGDPSAHHSTRETLRQIVDIANDLLCRCSKLQTRIQSHSHIHQFTQVC